MRHAGPHDPARTDRRILLAALILSPIIAVTLGALILFAAWSAVEWVLHTGLGYEAIAGVLVVVVGAGVWRARERSNRTQQ